MISGYLACMNNNNANAVKGEGNALRVVKDYELLDHGIDHAQYFSGCGVAYTSFENVVTGCGENFAEAIEDAFEQIAQASFDVTTLEERIREDEHCDRWPTAPCANEDVSEQDLEGSELYYYVSIRWN